MPSSVDGHIHCPPHCPEHPSPEELARYRGGQLSAAERARLAPHLDQCPDCQAQLDASDPQLALFARQAPPPPPRLPHYEYVLDERGFPQVLGYGGLGVVFLARYYGLEGHPPRAVKVLHTGFHITPRSRERFRREIEAISCLSRSGEPGFVQVFEGGESDGCLFYVMEYIAGGSLQRWRKEHPPAPRQAAEWLLALARTMAVAHRNGIFHRDLKPSNILVVTEARMTPAMRSLKIADFSHARWCERPSDLSIGELVGTPNYMAPEQARGEPADARVDVYGLCSILYELLTGHPPYHGQSALVTLDMVRSPDTVPLPPRSLRPELARALHRDLAAICMKGLEKEAGDRYSTVDALADDLQRFLRGEPTHARPVSAVERGWRWCRRSPAIAGLMSLLLVVVVFGSSLVLYQWRAAVAARRDAESNAADAEELLAEVVRASQSADLDWRLDNARAHAERLLEKRPGDARLRVRMARLLTSLQSAYTQRGRINEAAACGGRACDLWESLARADSVNLEYRIELAKELHRQAGITAAQGFFVRSLALRQKAEELWLAQCEEEPHNLAILEQTVENYKTALTLLEARIAREELLQPLEDSKAALVRLVHEQPGDRLARQRLARTWLLLGELHGQKPSPRMNEATECWRQAAAHYRTLAAERPSLAVLFPLADCYSRLLAGSAAGPWYQEAVTAMQQIIVDLAAIVDRHPDNRWLQQSLLAIEGSLALCHWTADRPQEAKQVFRAQLRRLDALMDAPNLNLSRKVLILRKLLDIGTKLREAKKENEALLVAREAATRVRPMRNPPASDPAGCAELAAFLLDFSGLYCQLHEPREALAQAVRARQLVLELKQARPHTEEYDFAVSSAWMRIGKAHVEQHQLDNALAAFDKSASVACEIFHRNAAVRANRAALSRCYDRLAWCATLGGRWADAAAALHARAQLWPGDAKQLREVAKEFAQLAGAVGGERKKLSPAEEADRRRYREESERVARAADGALKHPVPH